MSLYELQLLIVRRRPLVFAAWLIWLAALVVAVIHQSDLVGFRPVHWTFAGHPDRWASISRWASYRSLAYGFVGLVIVTIIGEKVRQHARAVLGLCAIETSVVSGAVTVAAHYGGRIILASNVVALVTAILVLGTLLFRRGAVAGHDSPPSPDNRQLLIPRTSGAGYSLNFRNPLGRPILILLLLLPVALAIMQIWEALHR